jgi:hypothetical protein
MRNSLQRLTYLSHATSDLSPVALRRILERAAVRNEHNRITGLLVVCEGSIVQILEGLRENVEATFARIEQDPRHKGIIRLPLVAIEKRDFTDWKMAFHTPDAAEIERLSPGFSRVLENPQRFVDDLETLSRHTQVILRSYARTVRMLP